MMGTPEYIRDDFDSCLAHFVEECGEALAAAGKIQRFGWASTNPELPEHKQETNIVWLQRELNDLTHAMFRLRACIHEDRLP